MYVQSNTHAAPDNTARTHSHTQHTSRLLGDAPYVAHISSHELQMAKLKWLDNRTVALSGLSHVHILERLEGGDRSKQ